MDVFCLFSPKVRKNPNQSSEINRVESFKVSNDPEFAAKLEDIVGLYLDPPEQALVLSVDEK